MTLRAVLKRKITINLKLFEDDASSVNVTNCRDIIKGFLSEIEAHDSKINEIYLTNQDGDDISEDFASELEQQSRYAADIRNKISVQTSLPEVSGESSNCKLKLPDIKCDVFSGEGSSYLEYHSFMSQFMNITGLRTNLSDSTKLTYLKSYLRGYALKLIKHLHVTDSNYTVAVDLLNSEFLYQLLLLSITALLITALEFSTGEWDFICIHFY